MGKKKRKHAPAVTPAEVIPPAVTKPPSVWGQRLKFAIYSLIPVTLLLLLGELGAHMIPGDLRSNRFFYVAGGHDEYFGTYMVSVPYHALPPYYWLGVPNSAIYNNRGFRGRDWHDEKAPGTVRIACLGDSCTAAGEEPYAQRLERLLREALGAPKYEVLNAGIGSSSTCQILQILERHVLPMHPDIAIVYPGWNDRWVHDRRRDSTHRLPTPAQTEIRNWLMKSRLFQAIVYYADKLRGDRVEERVPPDESRKNLRTIAKICRRNGIQVYFCTVPNAYTQEAMLSKFAENRPRNWDNDLYDLYRAKGNGPIEVWNYLTKLYADVVLQAAKDENVPVIDLVAWIKEREGLYTDPALHFFKDGIHFTELGLQEVAHGLATHVVSGQDLQAVNRYLDTPAYFMTNAVDFISQFQFAAADDFVRRAVAAGEPTNGVMAELRSKIAAERPFYDLFDAGRFELSDGTNGLKSLEMFERCLAMRPDEQNVRLEVARQAKGVGLYEKSLNAALGAKIDYTPENLYRALWIGVEAANEMGRGDVVFQILQEIVRRFPNDARARQILQQGGR